MGQLSLAGCVCPQGTHTVNSPMGTVLHVAQSVPLLPGSLITMPLQDKHLGTPDISYLHSGVCVWELNRRTKVQSF